MYQDPEIARERMKQWLQKELRARGDVLHAEAVDRARSQSPLSLSEEAWSSEVPWSAESRKMWLEGGSERFVQARYPMARATAVDRQVREQLTAHPPPAAEVVELWLQEIQEATSDHLLDRKQILNLQEKYLKARGLLKPGLLQEGGQRLSEVAREDLQRLADQVIAQQDALQKAALDKRVRAYGMAEAVAQALTEKVKAADAGLSPRDPLRHGPALGLWSGIRLEITAAAEKAADEEWKKALREQPFLWPHPEDVQVVFSEGWEPHQAPKKSVNILHARWWGEAKDRWLQQRVAVAKDLTAEQRERYLRQCKERLDRTDVEMTQLMERFNKKIQEVSEPVRWLLAEKQAAPVIEDLRKLYPLPPDQVEYWMEARDCRVFETIQELKGEAMDLWKTALPQMLEEAEKLVLDAANRLIKEAGEAHALQRGVVEGLEEDLGKELALDVQAGIPLSSIREKWMEAFENRWNQIPAGGQYPALFAANRLLLEKTLRQWYDRMQTDNAAPPLASGNSGETEVEVKSEASPSDLTEEVIDPPENTQEEKSTAEGTGGPEELPEAKQAMAFALKAPIVLVVTDTESNQVRLEVFFGDLQQIRQIDLPSGGTPEAVDQMVEELNPGLWVDALAKVKPPRGFLGLRRKSEPISVLVYVGSERMAYRTMLMIRERLTAAVEEEAAQRGESLPKMEWSAVPRPPRLR
ncbi:MAG: hypothetical protein ACO3NW_09105 [Kiritimatiellia bacterium]